MHIIVTYLVKDRKRSVLLYRKTQLRVNSYHKVKTSELTILPHKFKAR